MRERCQGRADRVSLVAHWTKDPDLWDDVVRDLSDGELIQGGRRMRGYRVATGTKRSRRAFLEMAPRIYRWTGGRIGGKMAGLPVLLIETIGRQSGERREDRAQPLTYLSGGDAFVVIASVLGEPRNPGWYLNLQADPKSRSGSGEVTSRSSPGGRGRGAGTDLGRLTEISPDYAQYRSRTVGGSRSWC